MNRRASAMRYKSAMDANALLAALLQATEHYEQDARHARWDGAFLSFVNANGLKPGLLGDAAGELVRTALVDDLVDAGSLRLEPPQAGAGIERKFALTSEGRRRARALSAAPLVGRADAVDLSWRTLRGRLAAFVGAYEQAGAPMQGLALREDSGEAIHLRTLVETGYLEETIFGTDQQTLLKPTERALAIVRAWPSALSTAREVVDDVVAELARRPEPEAASARSSLASGGRDLLVEVVAAAISKQSGLG